MNTLTGKKSKISYKKALKNRVTIKVVRKIKILRSPENSLIINFIDETEFLV